MKPNLAGAMAAVRRSWKVAANSVALVISTWFLLDPNPYAMALFVFVAQPLFLGVILGYLGSVWRDLRRRQVL